MYILLAVIIVIAALLLIGAVLVQKSKGGGLASNYASGNQYMGYRKTTDFIEKTTWTLAIVICVLSICSSFAIKKPKTNTAAVTAPVEKTAPAPGTQGNATPAAAPATKATPAPAAKAPAAATEKAPAAPAAAPAGNAE